MATATDPYSQPVSAIPGSTAETPQREADSSPGRRFVLFQLAPAWLVSTLVHVLIVLVLGLVTLADPVKIVNVLTANATKEDGPEIEEFTIHEIDPGALSETEELTEPVQVMEQLEITDPAPVDPLDISVVPLEITDLAAQMAPSKVSLQKIDAIAVAPMSSRSEDMKKKLLREYGGNDSSEAAVTEALKWLSRHQMPNGAWTYHHHLVCRGACGDPGDPSRARALNAATAMALLPFLGAGQTHVQGQFKDVVHRGLRFLVQNGKAGKQAGLPVVDYSEGGGNMYSHGLATIALCEAYAMTEDPQLVGPAQGALNFILYAQCPRDGGWRYRPQQPDGGDTSVTGWQIMALKSGHMGHLAISPNTIERSKFFLDKVGANNGSIYGYAQRDTKVRPACTAIGLLCRMYTGWDKSHPGIVQGAKELSKIGVLKNDIYYDYYAAQVLRHYGGAEWDKFNVELRDWLVSTQVERGGGKGSWHFPESASHRGPKEGGRLASTSFATMILEVYYRHMPLYADAAADEDFPL